MLNINTPKHISTIIDEKFKNDTQLAKNQLLEIIDKLPSEYSELINASFKHQRIPKEYLLTSILFTVSTSIGSSFYIEELGFKNCANLYFTIVGSRGDAKSAAIKTATNPLKQIDDYNYNEYKQALREHPDDDDENKPVREQILVQNATIEATHIIHSENPKVIGIYQDEIYSLFNKMVNPNSRDGVEWRQLFLESYTNEHIDVSRKTTDSFRIEQTYVTLIGGIQHQFIGKMFANGNLESGLIDRLLFTPKLTNNNKLCDEPIPYSIINNYNSLIINIKSASERTSEQKLELTENAKNLLSDYSQQLIELKETAPPIIEEYIAKMQISIHKFCIISHFLLKSNNDHYWTEIDVECVQLAIDFNEFFFRNFKIILKQKETGNQISIEDITKYAISKGLKQKDVVQFTGTNKGTVSRIWNKLNQDVQPATCNSNNIAA